MPRERGLNYTPDADGYSFDDTAIGEAAQASFHRLASGYPQQEPDDIHHLADVITGIRDSTIADMELRKASGLYSMTQARAIDTILDRADALWQHYQDRRIWNSARTSGTSGQTCSATRKRCCPNGITTTSTS